MKKYIISIKYSIKGVKSNFANNYFDKNYTFHQETSPWQYFLKGILEIPLLKDYCQQQFSMQHADIVLSRKN